MIVFLRESAIEPIFTPAFEQTFELFDPTLKQAFKPAILGKPLSQYSNQHLSWPSRLFAPLNELIKN